MKNFIIISDYMYRYIWGLPTLVTEIWMLFVILNIQSFIMAIGSVRQLYNMQFYGYKNTLP